MPNKLTWKSFSMTHLQEIHTPLHTQINLVHIWCQLWVLLLSTGGIFKASSMFIQTKLFPMNNHLHHIHSRLAFFDRKTSFTPFKIHYKSDETNNFISIALRPPLPTAHIIFSPKLTFLSYLLTVSWVRRILPPRVLAPSIGLSICSSVGVP